MIEDKKSIEILLSEFLPGAMLLQCRETILTIDWKGHAYHYLVPGLRFDIAHFEGWCQKVQRDWLKKEELESDFYGWKRYCRRQAGEVVSHRRGFIA